MILVVGQNSGTVSEIIEPSPEVTGKEREEYAWRFTRLIREADVLLIQGTAMLGVSLQKDILGGASPGAFPEGFSFFRALIYGTAMGSANCLTLQPGLVKRGSVEDLMNKLQVHSKC